MEVDLRASLARAKENNRKLLKGWQVFCTERITGGFDTYKAIVEANGGSCLLFKNKTNMSTSKRMLNTEIPAANQEDYANFLYLVSDTSKEEVALWEPFNKMAEKANMEPMIVKKEWLLGVAMSQTITWKDEWGH
jgi:hypothetical protein